MTILLNGQATATDAADVASLVTELDLPPQAVLVEHSGVALHRSEWPSRALSEGDRIEILRVVAGG